MDNDMSINYGKNDLMAQGWFVESLLTRSWYPSSTVVVHLAPN